MMAETADATLRRRVRASAETEARPPYPSEAFPDLASQAHSPVAALWLESRRSTESPSEYRPQGEERRLTVRNIKIAVQLVQLVGYRFLALFIKGQEWRVAAFLAGMISRDVLPTAKIWASSRMLDMVQASFEPGGVDKAEIIRVAIMSVAFSVAGDAIRYVLRDNDALVKAHVNTILERAYLNAQLSLSIPNLSSPYISALMYEAGIFAGYDHPTRTNARGVSARRYGAGGPFDALTTGFHLIATLIGILSQLYLVYTALSGGAATSIGGSSLILIALSLAPTLLRMIAGIFRPASTRVATHKARMSENEIRSMAKGGPKKQELVLFGLKDWVLARWDRLRRETELARRNQRQGHRKYELALGIAEESIQNSFYVLLALRSLPTNLSLGSIRLYQRSVEYLLGSLRGLSNTFSQVFNVIFFIAAYLEAIELPAHPELLRSPAYRHTECLDLENHRVEGGMELIATDLSFRYPDTTQDVLHGINLTIRPGTTLAIVGLNGGGKTTLVKILMGLYDYQGSLTLNGHAMASFDPSSVHRRTSCLFQDFAKYSFTLRENVGIGQVEWMDEDEMVEFAIERGGACGVLERVGMEGKLSVLELPGSSGAGDIQLSSDTKSSVPKVGKRGGWVKRFKRLFRAGIGGSTDTSSGASVMLGTPLSPKSPASPELDTASSSLENVSPPSTATSATSEKARGSGQSAKLSGGQWQRVALSRAFMRASEADLVVFDEPSASLDPRAESELFERIHALSHQRQCTTIYISHRFSTVRKADQIAVVQDGTIIECGSHAELMAKDGRYCELYNLQKGSFE